MWAAAVRVCNTRLCCSLLSFAGNECLRLSFIYGAFSGFCPDWFSCKETKAHIPAYFIISDGICQCKPTAESYVFPAILPLRSTLSFVQKLLSFVRKLLTFVRKLLSSMRKLLSFVRKLCLLPEGSIFLPGIFPPPVWYNGRRKGS